MSNLTKSFFLSAIVYALIVALIYVSYLLLDQMPKPPQKTEVDLTQLEFKKLPKPVPVVKPHETLTTTPYEHAKKETFKKPEPITPKKVPFPTKESLQKASQQHVKEVAKETSTFKSEYKNEIKKIPFPKSTSSLADTIMKDLPVASSTPHASSKTDLEKLYGEAYENLSIEQKRYIEDNFLYNQAVAQGVLNRLGQFYLNNNIRYNTYNIVEFTLYPDGSISNVTFVQKSNIDVLEKLSVETFLVAHKDFRPPKEPTLLRYYIYY